MKELHVLAALLMGLGGLQLGLHGLVRAELGASALGGTVLAAATGALLGLAAARRALQRRWQVQPELSR